MKSFLYKYLLVIIFLGLLIAPFFWFEKGTLDLGGDSARLYFLDPIACLKNIAILNPNTSNAMGVNTPLFYLLPFVIFLAAGKNIFFDSAYLLNCLFYGFLLAGGFLFFYLSIKEVFIRERSKISWTEKISFILAGLLFVLSPINFFKFPTALLSNNQVAIYPLFFYIFLKFLKTKRYRYLVVLIGICFIFSINFSLNVMPWFLAFFVFVGLFMFFYALIEKRLLVLFKGVSLFLFLFLLTQTFQLAPQVYGLMDSSSPYSQMIEGKINIGLQYFESVRPYVHLYYNLGNQDQYDIVDRYGVGGKMLIYEYGAKHLALFFIYPLVMIFGIVNFRKIKDLKVIGKYGLIFCVLIFLLFFMTANIGAFGVELYWKLFDIPGFSMFRSFYTKFNFVFTFFYALLFGYSLVVVLGILNIKKIKVGLIGVIFCLIIFNSWPFLSGSVMNSYRAGAERIRSVLKVDDNYMNFLNFVKNKKIDGKYLSFPLTGEEYVVVKGSDDGVYVGPSMVGTISGKNDFVGLGSFSIYRDNLLEILKNRDVEKIKSLNSILNIGYIIHNSDDYIYDNFSHPYTNELKNIFPNQDGISEFIAKLNLVGDLNIASFSLYSNRENFLPHFYTSKNSIISQRPVENIARFLSGDDWQTRSAVFLASQNVGKESLLEILRQTQDTDSVDRDDNKLPTMEFKKINPTKYRIKIHQAQGIFPLIFSESFNDGWKMYLKEYRVDSRFRGNDTLGNYKILDGNDDDQATKDEVQDYISKGYATTLGDGKEKTIEHNPSTGSGYEEKYSIDFISKNFQGTIQNDNLSNGNIFETWFKKPIENNANHLMANGYANSWVVDADKICGNDSVSCVKNADGSYDFEILVEFWPQRLFYVGLTISLSTLIGCVVYLVYDWRRRRKSD